MLGSEKKFLAMSGETFHFDANPFAWNLFNNATASQITTFIQSMEYTCQDKLNQLNEVLVNLNK